MTALLPPTNAELLRAQYGDSQCAVLAVSLLEAIAGTKVSHNTSLKLERRHGAGQVGQQFLLVPWWNIAATRWLGAEPSCQPSSPDSSQLIRQRLFQTLGPDLGAKVSAGLSTLALGHTAVGLGQTLPSTNYYIHALPCRFVDSASGAAASSPLGSKHSSRRSVFFQCCLKPSVAFKGVDGEEADGRQGSEPNRVLATLLLQLSPTQGFLHQPLPLPDNFTQPKSASVNGALAALAANADAADRTAAMLGWARMDGLCLAGLPMCVTVFTRDGHVAHQNAASVGYYGKRSSVWQADTGGIAAFAAAAAAAGVDAGVAAPEDGVRLGLAKVVRFGGAAAGRTVPLDGNDPLRVLSLEGRSSACYVAGDVDVLSQLFVLDRNKLEQLMSCAFGSGGVWEGIVRVPHSMNPNAPSSATSASVSFQGNAVGVADADGGNREGNGRAGAAGSPVVEMPVDVLHAGAAAGASDNVPFNNSLLSYKVSSVVQMPSPAASERVSQVLLDDGGAAQATGLSFRGSQHGAGGPSAAHASADLQATTTTTSSSCVLDLAAQRSSRSRTGVTAALQFGGGGTSELPRNNSAGGVDSRNAPSYGDGYTRLSGMPESTPDSSTKSGRDLALATAGGHGRTALIDTSGSNLGSPALQRLRASSKSLIMGGGSVRGARRSRLLDASASAYPGSAPFAAATRSLGGPKPDRASAAHDPDAAADLIGEGDLSRRVNNMRLSGLFRSFTASRKPPQIGDRYRLDGGGGGAAEPPVLPSLAAMLTVGSSEGAPGQAELRSQRASVRRRSSQKRYVSLDPLATSTWQVLFEGLDNSSTIIDGADCTTTGQGNGILSTYDDEETHEEAHQEAQHRDVVQGSDRPAATASRSEISTLIDLGRQRDRGLESERSEEEHVTDKLQPLEVVATRRRGGITLLSHLTDRFDASATGMSSAADAAPARASGTTSARPGRSTSARNLRVHHYTPQQALQQTLQQQQHNHHHLSMTRSFTASRHDGSILGVPAARPSSRNSTSLGSHVLSGSPAQSSPRVLQFASSLRGAPKNRGGAGPSALGYFNPAANQLELSSQPSANGIVSAASGSAANTPRRLESFLGAARLGRSATTLTDWTGFDAPANAGQAGNRLSVGDATNGASIRSGKPALELAGAANLAAAIAAAAAEDLAANGGPLAGLATVPWPLTDSAALAVTRGSMPQDHVERVRAYLQTREGAHRTAAGKFGLNSDDSDDSGDYAGLHSVVAAAADATCLYPEDHGRGPGERAGRGTDTADSDPYRAVGLAYHEVQAASVVNPVSGERYLLVVQKDVTAKVEAERHIAKVSECEHRLLEQIFPRHVLAYMTEEGLSPPPPVYGGDPVRPSVTSRGGMRPSVASLHKWRPYVRDCTRLATWHDQVTVLFADIQGFTPMCKQLPPAVVMKLLNDLFVRFDAQLDLYGVYKVETIGDCYVVAGGLMHEDADGMAAVHGQVDRKQADKVFAFAQSMLRSAARVRMPTNGQPVKIRVGIHSGPVVSGVVGTRMPRFCLFGDTINTASRMESTGTPGSIHASSDTYSLLSGSRVGWAATGGVEVKGKGMMETYMWEPNTTAQGTGGSAGAVAVAPSPPPPSCQDPAALGPAAGGSAAHIPPPHLSPEALGAGGAIGPYAAALFAADSAATVKAARSSRGVAGGDDVWMGAGSIPPRCGGEAEVGCGDQQRPEARASGVHRGTERQQGDGWQQRQQPEEEGAEGAHEEGREGKESVLQVPSDVTDSLLVRLTFSENAQGHIAAAAAPSSPTVVKAAAARSDHANTGSALLQWID